MFGYRETPMLKPFQKKWSNAAGSKPLYRIAGAGLFALDVVVCDDEKAGALTFAGGTCGNVLSILSYLSWSSVAVGFVGTDVASKRMVADLKRVGVNAHQWVQEREQSVPVFVQRLERDQQGLPKHTFSDFHRCPHCGHTLGGRGNLARETATPIRSFEKSEKLDVFFMDRLSEDILSLAESAKSRGALVFYEPSAKSDVRFWSSANTLVDIVKYSADRFDSQEMQALFSPRRPAAAWEIQTLGARGLRYRRHAAGTRKGTTWVASQAIAAPRLIDTCGAGDWCSAGLLHGLMSQSKRTDTESFATAVRMGQALAAWGCAFVGARGAMYCNDASTTWTVAKALIAGRTIDLSALSARDISPTWHFESCLADLCRSE
jgi:sugar/nucleoside kinase (ribokinase family)